MGIIYGPRNVSCDQPGGLELTVSRSTHFVSNRTFKQKPVKHKLTTVHVRV